LLTTTGRSVESTPIKKAIDATYSTFLPKGGHPFVYLSLEIEPHRVDVNVHPTKREVNFLHEDEIIEKIAAAIQEKLASVDTSRSYALTQTLLPGTTRLGQDTVGRQQWDLASHAGPSKSRSQVKKPYENNTVRVDHRDQKITSMLPQISRGDSGTVGAGAGGAMEYEYDDGKQWEKVRYSTIKTLRQQVHESAHGGLAELFLNHTYVGLVDAHKRLAAVQHGVKLYLVDYAAVCYEMFYQIGLSDFRNFGHIRFNPPLPVRDLLQIAAEEEREFSDKAAGQNASAKGKDSSANRGDGRGGRSSSRDDGDDDDVVMDEADMQSDSHDAFDWEGATEV
jgi:DNA mismatch repair protein MLH1